MNQVSDKLPIQSLAFLEKKITAFRKNLKIDNYSYCIKNKTIQKKELKYRRKNIVCLVIESYPWILEIRIQCKETNLLFLSDLMPTFGIIQTTLRPMSPKVGHCNKISKDPWTLQTIGSNWCLVETSCELARIGRYISFLKIYQVSIS